MMTDQSSDKTWGSQGSDGDTLGGYWGDRDRISEYLDFF